MKKIIGQIITAMVVDKNQKNLFAQKDGITFKVLDQDVEESEIGDMIEGFVYINKKDDYVMMTNPPLVQQGAYGWGEVVDVRRDLGVFVDVGWLEKDLVVSLDDLPVFMNIWPRKGDKMILTVEIDEKDRMWGKLKPVEDIIRSFKEGTKELFNADISGTVIASLKAGSYVALDENLLGFIHPNEREEEPRLGEFVEGRVIGLRDDGVLYMSLFPRAHEILDDDASMILEVLKRSTDYRIPYHDKSDPQDIRDYFGISKGQFKRAVGRLMKNEIVKQDSEGTFLVSEYIENEL